MIIKDLRATFGALNGSELHLKPGLNVITAPNEAGKSTWMAFLRAMFYGIDTKQRDKDGALADKNRYRPWSGADMEGSMVLEVAGRDILLTRTTAAANAPMRKFSAVYKDTGDDLADITGESAGVRLLGVEQEVFRRSCFIGQNALGVDRAPELEKRIESLVTAGDEGISWSETDAKLREWERKISYPRSGELPKVRERLEEVERLLSRQREMNRASGELRDRIRRLSETKNDLERDIARSDAIRRAEDTARRYEAARRREKAVEHKREADAAFEDLKRVPLRSELEGSLAALELLRRQEERLTEEEAHLTELRAGEEAAVAALAEPGPYAGMKAGEAWESARESADRAKAGLERSRKRGLTALGIALLVLGIAAAALGLFRVLPLPAAIAGGVVAVCGAILAAVSLLRRKKAAREAAELLRENGAGTPEDVLEHARLYGEKCRAAETAAALRQEQEEDLERSRQDRDAAREKAVSPMRSAGRTGEGPEEIEAFDRDVLRRIEAQTEAGAELREAERLCALVGGYAGEELVDPATLEKPALERDRAVAELAETRVQLESSSKELNMNDGAVLEMGDPAALAAEKRQLTARQEELTFRLEALQGAQEVLREADRKVRERFSPVLNQRASELLRRLTGGRYETLMLDREFSGQAVAEHDATGKDMAWLSAGTVDQIYLAVRLAVCDLVLSRERAVPVILDDALVSFDDARMRAALDLLAEYARDRQVILFTCQGREAEALRGREDVNLMTL